MNPYGNDLIVDQVIGSAYQVVKYVASNMEALIQLSDFIQTIPAGGIADLIEFLPELQEIYDNLPAIIDSSLVVAASREAIVRSYNEAGFPMNKTESFEVGGTINTTKETLLYEQNGVGYSWGGTLPKSVPADSTPATTGGIGPAAWIDQSTKLLRQQLTAISGNLTPAANWDDVPSFSDPELGGSDGPINAQANALAARTELLRIHVVERCPSVAVLRSTEPVSHGQLINVSSYYNDWAVVVGGEPKYGGQFWYDANDSVTLDDGYKCFVTASGKRWKRVKGVYGVGHAGAKEDLSIDSTVQVQSAINGTKAGQELRFDDGPFMWDKVDLPNPIVLTGGATLKHNGFRVKSSKVTSRLSGEQICRAYQSSSRAFEVIAFEDVKDYENIKILFNDFRGFFYSVNFRARGYNASVDDPTNRVVKNTLIMGCTSTAPSGVNAGHFQHTGITNAKCIGCSAYGGANATSYNFINGNGYLIVQGCYDQDNTYGSLEIENNQLCHAVVSGNVFARQLWIDDTSNVSITGNTLSDRILITAQHNDTDNITISGNTCTRISVTEFGTDPIGRHKSVHIIGNTIYDEAAGNGIFSDGSVDRITIESNSLSGAVTSAIAVVRSANCNHLIRNNRSRISKPLSISGTGGRVVEYGNDNMPLSGVSDSKFLADMMRPNASYLDLPGKYLHGTKYTGSISPGGSMGVTLDIPDSGTLAFRGVALWVLIRDSSNNSISSFRIDGRYIVVGSVQLNFGTAYSTQGADFGSVTVANNTSTTSSINILVSNTSGTKTFQVTIMPEVSSRLGVED